MAPQEDRPSSQETPGIAAALHEGAGLSGIIQRLEALPSYHPTVLALLTISTEAESAVEDFENVFKRDPGFATELLQIANSPAFGFPGRIGSIRHALTLLGLERVSGVAFSLAMQFYMSKLPKMQDVQAIWTHSVATSVVAEAITEVCGFRCPDVSTAALVHDLGRLGLLMTEGQRYVNLAAQECEDCGDYLAKESSELGITHTEAGAVMAERWGFPEPLCESIRWHHDAFGTPLVGTLAVVSRACRLATSLGFPAVHYRRVDSADEILEELPAELRAKPNLQPDRLLHTIEMVLNGVGAHEQAI